MAISSTPTIVGVINAVIAGFLVALLMDLAYGNKVMSTVAGIAVGLAVTGYMAGLLPHRSMSTEYGPAIRVTPPPDGGGHAVGDLDRIAHVKVFAPVSWHPREVVPATVPARAAMDPERDSRHGGCQCRWAWRLAADDRVAPSAVRHATRPASVSSEHIAAPLDPLVTVSGCKVTCAIPNRVRSSAVNSSNTSCQARLPVTSTWQLSATRPDVIVQMCRSWAPATPFTAAIASRTRAGSMSFGASSGSIVLGERHATQGVSAILARRIR